ncbi:alpha/beta hydrolase-fold protein [Rhodanobacter sp. PCA2]|uniref:alpha/beta hydrolase n=1 Tax=Rhodanobacter sp. PCA2 TaxID=2006117 RepID=UPI0015E700DB|nr:alpha/beta hydrolase-fold protein [Rhodanobacter sp. PCA2]MBA2079896.1 esterase [Rhodanobacter sp. PCA2]
MRHGGLLALLFACWPLHTFAADACTPVQRTLQLDAAAFAPERITVDVYLPGDYAGTQHRYRVVYADDGQDMPAVGLLPTLTALCRAHAIRPPIVVAVHMLRDRMGIYGLSDRAHRRSLPADTKYGPVGRRAHDYSQWLATQLVPYIDAHYRTRRDAASRSMLGWSLGGLNAFNLGWQYPEVFGRVGAFSPSFWLAADRSSDDAVERTRLAQRMVDRGPKRPQLRFWFAAGTAEETSDRDHDGVIDVIGDIRDLVDGYRAADGFRLRGLRQLGCSVNPDYAAHPGQRADVAVYLLPGGRHEQASWAKMLPLFLRWDDGVGR